MSELESDIQSAIMVEATVLGHRLMRNNVGVAKYTHAGGISTVPYGVGGKGAADLVGFTFVEYYVEPWMPVLVPVFTCIECKSLRGAKRKEQERFIAGMQALGCIAGFCRSVTEYRALIGAK